MHLSITTRAPVVLEPESQTFVEATSTPPFNSPGDPRRRIGARVRVSHLDQGRREEFEGVVVGCQKYGVNVRMADGTIRGFSDVEVSPAEPDERLRRSTRACILVAQ